MRKRRERESEVDERDLKKKCIWEIQTDNTSLAVKILIGTPRPIRERESEGDRERK